MFDSAIVDVIIGLVFIYILLSIICSGLTEFIVGKLLSLRSKNLQQGLISMLSDEKLLKKFNEHPLIKGLTKPGENPSYIPSDIFARALLDILNLENPDKTIESAISAIPHEDIKKLLRSLQHDVRADLSNIQKNLSKWYDDSMERFSGWYQRKAQNWTYGIAIAVVIVLNVDSFTIANKLWIDKELREYIVSAAEESNRTRTETGTDGKESNQRVEEGRAAYAELTGPGLPIGWDFSLKYQYIIDDAKASGLQKNKDLRKKNMNCLTEFSNRLGTYKDKEFKTNKELSDFIKSLSESNKTQDESEKRCQDFILQNEQTIIESFNLGIIDLVAKYPGIFWRGVCNHWLGWIFTAMAVSLGAPFWFDILNKIINARIAGKKPEAEEEKKLQNKKK